MYVLRGLNSDINVQGSDTTDGDSSNAVCAMIIFFYLSEIFCRAGPLGILKMCGWVVKCNLCGGALLIIRKLITFGT